jgi:hypothetical protein
MDAREARIASRFAEAERMRDEARKTAEEFDSRNRELQERAEEMMITAQKASEKEKERLMDSVRSEVGRSRGAGTRPSATRRRPSSRTCAVVPGPTSTTRSAGSCPTWPTTNSRTGW